MNEPVETKNQQGPEGARSSPPQNVHDATAARNASSGSPPKLEQQSEIEDLIDWAYGVGPYSNEEDMLAFSTGENAENEKPQSEMVSKGSNDERIRIWTDEIYKNTALSGEKGEAPETDLPSFPVAGLGTFEKPSSGEKKRPMHHGRKSSQALPAEWLAEMTKYECRCGRWSAQDELADPSKLCKLFLTYWAMMQTDRLLNWRITQLILIPRERV